MTEESADEMPGVAEAKPHRKQSRRGRRYSHRDKVRPWRSLQPISWKTPDRIMAALAVLWLVLAAQQLAGSVGAYAGATIGMAPQDALYAWGQPNSKSGDTHASTWIYTSPATSLALEFRDGSLGQVNCTPRGEACPGFLDVDPGAQEGDLWAAFGSPTSQAYQGETKLVDFADFGLRYRMKRFEATDVSVYHSTASWGLRDLLWIFTP